MQCCLFWGQPWAHRFCLLCFPNSQHSAWNITGIHRYVVNWIKYKPPSAAFSVLLRVFNVCNYLVVFFLFSFLNVFPAVAYELLDSPKDYTLCHWFPVSNSVPGGHSFSVCWRNDFCSDITSTYSNRLYWSLNGFQSDWSPKSTIYKPYNL